MADFSFLFPSHSPLPVAQVLQDTTSKPPPMRPSNLPPLIILDDYSMDSTHQDSPVQAYCMSPGFAESPLALSPHYNIHSASSNSDSDLINPPSSAISSEPSSAVASDLDLLFPPMAKSSGPKKQTGINQFFRTLAEDEVQAIQAKRKRVDSEEEEADRAKCRKKEEEQKQKKLISRRDRNRVSQQNHRDKLVKVDIHRGVRDNSGKLIKVSLFMTMYIM